MPIAAQGYQESRLDQSVRSSVGAIGIMQVMPETARDRNVEAGVKHLRHLRDAYFHEPGISPFDRACFTSAAYNAGPGAIRKARARAAIMGLDPNAWFGQVEVTAGRTISREPVVYVRNILKYCTSYRIFEAQEHGAAEGAAPGRRVIGRREATGSMTWASHRRPSALPIGSATGSRRDTTFG